MSPKIFITYFLLLSGKNITETLRAHTVKIMMEYHRSEDPAIRVAYQMLVLDALKRCKYREDDVDKLLSMPEDWDTFLGSYK
jgi:hypothetical protein